MKTLKQQIQELEADLNNKTHYEITSKAGYSKQVIEIQAKLQTLKEVVKQMARDYKYTESGVLITIENAIVRDYIEHRTGYSAEELREMRE